MVLIAAGVVLLVNLILLILAVSKRVPGSHSFISGIVSALFASFVLISFPQHLVSLLLLGLIPLLDVARWHGWAALLLTAFFPLPALGYLITQDQLQTDDPAQTLLLVAWALTAFLVSWMGVAQIGTIGSFKEPEKKEPETDVDSLMAKFAQKLAFESNYERILELITRSGVEVLDGLSRKSKAKSMAFTFKPGLSDVLIVPASHNMESNVTTRSFELQGVLQTLLQDGEPIDAMADQPPFNDVRALEGYRLLLFPLRTGIDVYGSVLFATKDPERAEDIAVQRTLLGLVDQASLALHNAVLKQELRHNREQRLGGQEEARHQLARDLHDGPVQRVAAIAMQLEFIKALLQRQPDRALGELEQLQEVAKQAAQEMRTMLFTLRPVVLESEGLTAAMDTLVKRLREQDRLKISFEHDPLPRLDSKVEEVAFAILQEAIGNAKKYSGGAPIHVRLIKGQSMVVGQVEDEGPGFDLKAVTASYGTRASLGLLNMQERAAMVGGQLKIDTAPGRGTVVSVAVPFVRE
ncbi:MAG: sensor histidine kinase [Ardenticatenales bacterium]|nr:sensor histidine kinase [Ardenticatenales bacterium]